MSKSNFLYISIILLVVCLVSSAFIVKETETAIVTEFGKPKKTILEPGLYFRIPFIQKVMKFESRVLEWDGDRTEIPTYDKKFIFVDTFARWKISDPLQFFKALKDENGAQSKIGDIINGAVRDAIAKRYMPELIMASENYPVNVSIVDDEGNEEIIVVSGARTEIINTIFNSVALLVNIKYLDEPFIDSNTNGLYDKAEEFNDIDKNGAYDIGEEFSDINYGKISKSECRKIENSVYYKSGFCGNGKYDKAEEFVDIDNNGLCTPIEPYIDKNENGSYDVGEKYTDLNQNKKYDFGGDNPDFLNLGIEILDVQIKRLRYTSTVEQAVFRQMITEQYEIAEEFRGRGQGAKLEISGLITKEEKRILSEAYKEAQTIKGDADATAIRIYANAYGKNEDFYNFYKSLETYKNTLDPSTFFILSTDSKYLRFLEK